MSELNKELMRRFAGEVVNSHNLDAADALIDEHFVEHEQPFESGLDGFKRGLEMFFTAFPDLTMTIEDLISEDDRVVSRATFRGTHRGEFMGLAPTQKQVQVTAIDVVRFSHDKVVEHWGLTDMHSLLEQLGAASPPP